MTREEAIRQLEYFSVCSENHVTMAINSRDRQAIDMAIEALGQPECKTGRWLLRTYMPHKNYCSNCGNDSPYDTRWHYCPKCGARMEGNG